MTFRLFSPAPTLPARLGWPVGRTRAHRCHRLVGWPKRWPVQKDRPGWRGWHTETGAAPRRTAPPPEISSYILFYHFYKTFNAVKRQEKDEIAPIIGKKAHKPPHANEA